jgi:putative flippase GtrA
MADRYNGTGHRAGVEREGRAIIVAYAQGLLRRRIVRYALVGGIGIPVDLLALALVLHLVGDRLYPLASACAFEVSTSVNFVLNQLYTYGEQKHLRGWEWPRRALKAQMASLSALAIAYALALALKYGVHVSPYLANATGIVCAFFYNFTIANRFVFRPAPAAESESAAK